MSRGVHRASLSEQVTEGILALIRETGLRSGDSIPPTAELADTFDVSVPVVREAIAGLAALGVLRRQQGRETVVSTPEAAHLARLLRFRVESAEVDDPSIQRFREVVEVGNAELAAQTRDDAALERLDEALARLRAASTDEELHEADVAFHAAVARAGGNDLFILTLEAMEPLLHRLRSTVWKGWVASGGDLVSIVEAHAVILDRIRAQDARGAAAAMHDHLMQARRGLEVEVGDDDPPPPPPDAPARPS